MKGSLPRKINQKLSELSKKLQITEKRLLLQKKIKLKLKSRASQMRPNHEEIASQQKRIETKLQLIKERLFRSTKK